MTAVHRYPAGAPGQGSHCWCGATYLNGHVSSLEVDGTRHARGWCSRERRLSQTPGMASPGASPETG